MLKEIDENIKETDLIQKDPESFVFGYFEKIINQVDIQREKLIDKINLYSEKTIETIKKARDDCLSAENKTNFISTDYETMKENVNEMYQELNSFDINDKKMEDLIKNLINTKSTSSMELKRIQDNLLLSKLCKFEPVQVDNIDIEELLGSFLTMVFIF